MVAVALVLLRGRNPAGLIAGVVLSLPLYVGFSAAMAKLGYQRKTLSEMRTARTASAGTRATVVGRRHVPSRPTKRTVGPSRAAPRAQGSDAGRSADVSRLRRLERRGRSGLRRVGCRAGGPADAPVELVYGGSQVG